MADTTAMMSSARTEWQTPEELLRVVRRFAGPWWEGIGLDPCAPMDRNPCGVTTTISVGHRQTWTGPAGGVMATTCESRGGLVEDWGGQGLVYCNPPYGRAIPAWASKMAAEGGTGTEIVSLLPARTDTQWWHAYVATAQVVAFWRGRLRFVDPQAGQPAAVWSQAAGRMVGASAPFPSAIAYWGPRVTAFRNAFLPLAWVP